VTWASASQLGKTVIAAVVAWVLAVDVFHLAQAFMAPTAWHLFGLDAASLAAAVLAGLLLGSVRGVRAETTTAATAVVVLTTGYLDKRGMLTARLADTGIGIVVGLVVNFVMWAPLRDRSAANQIDVIDDRAGDLLVEIAARLRKGFKADDVDGWIARADELDNDVDRAWNVIEEARESGRFNPRRAVPQRMQAAERFVPIVNLLHRSGTAVSDADTDEVGAARAELRALANRLAVDELHDGLWPVYGALLINLRNVLDALDAVVEAQPVQVASPALL
jgi:uncharacterized membrane protein YgaE (UPF0421/DUF939 family)